MLQGKTALVTGSTSGIGLGIACALAAQGANIVMNGFGDVDGPKARIAGAGKDAVRVGYHGADMSKPAEIEAMFAYADAEFGGVDILVNTPASSTWPTWKTSRPSAGTPSSPSTCRRRSTPRGSRCRA